LFKREPRKRGGATAEQSTKKIGLDLEALQTQGKNTCHGKIFGDAISRKRSSVRSEENRKNQSNGRRGKNKGHWSKRVVCFPSQMEKNKDRTKRGYQGDKKLNQTKKISSRGRKETLPNKDIARRLGKAWGGKKKKTREKENSEKSGPRDL